MGVGPRLNLAVVDGQLLLLGGLRGTALTPTGRRLDRRGTGGAGAAGRIWIPGGAHRLRYEPTADVESLVP